MLHALSALLLAAGGAVAPSVAPASVSVTAKPNVIVVRAKDFSFVVPKNVTAGLTTFRLVNDGKELHHLSIIKLAKGKTLANYMDVVKAGSPPPAWATDVGGPNAALPGKTVEATLSLDAGNYVISCWIPSPGETAPHAMKGMIQALTVVPAPASVAQAGAAKEPAPDVHLTLIDYGFKFSKPLVAGRQTIHVMNDAGQPHEVIFAKLAPGKTAQELNAWIMEKHMQGPPPATPIDGMAGLATGRTGSFPANLTAGEYALLCLVPDSKDGKPHTAHGMITQITVK